MILTQRTHSNTWIYMTIAQTYTHTLQLYSTTLWFYILFFFVHMITTFIVTVEIYYRWQIDIKQSFKQVFKLCAQKIGAPLCKRKQEVEIEGEGQREGEGERDGEGEGVEDLKSDNRQSIFQLFEMYRKEGLCPPKHKVTLIMSCLKLIVQAILFILAW